eukprot:gene6194-7715_t
MTSPPNNKKLKLNHQNYSFLNDKAGNNDNNNNDVNNNNNDCHTQIDCSKSNEIQLTPLTPPQPPSSTPILNISNNNNNDSKLVEFPSDFEIFLKKVKKEIQDKKDQQKRTINQVSQFKKQNDAIASIEGRKTSPIKNIKQNNNNNNNNNNTTTSKDEDDYNFENDEHLFDSLFLKLFNVEVSSTGKRVFITSTYEGFWNSYKDLPTKNHYEVIKENEYCHMYFDLEYLRDSNPQLINDPVEDDKIVQVLVDRLSKEILNRYDIVTDRKDIIDLDSSTEKKFSRHLIWHFPNSTCWINNFQLGLFIKNFIEKIEIEKNNDQDILKYLFVNTDKNQTTTVLDKGVYTKNRSFRLYLSSKFGKPATLQLSKFNQFPFSSPTNHEEIFMGSLICNIDLTKNLRILDFTLEKPREPSLFFNNNSNSNSQNNNISPSKLHQQSNTTTSTTTTTSNYSPSSIQICLNQSPFPKIDEYVKTNLLGRGGEKGFIRKIKYDTNRKTIQYEIGGNKWCENIGRQHKSNNIYFICYIESGTIFQRCMDSDCKNFKSTPIYLPLFND